MGLPLFSNYSQHTSPSQDPLTSTLGGLHPSLEGRGQVAASLGAWRLKKKGQKMCSKEDLYEVLTFLTCLAAFVEARGVLWEVKSEIDRDQRS
jgi:hypothetical protein